MSIARVEYSESVKFHGWELAEAAPDFFQLREDRVKKLREEIEELLDAIKAFEGAETSEREKALLHVLEEAADVSVCADLLAVVCGDENYFEGMKLFKIVRERLRRRVGDKRWCATNPKPATSTSLTRGG